jgi:hypothetical protein
MWRTALAAALVSSVYGYGHPGFEGYRPAVLDRPLQAFHTEINQIARDGHRIISNLDNTRAAHALRTYVEQADSQLRSKIED